MKLIQLAPSVALAVLLSAGCGRKSSEVAKQISELERKANEATGRQKELERQLEEQKLAAERDAIERERMEIESARAELERRQDDTAAADAEKLRQREEALANREGKVDLLQSTLEDKQRDLEQRDQQLSERDRELAGREALASDDDDNGDDAPTADYGMFHDSLSSYGSWFETPDYGYVWQPVVVRNVSWRPYLHGRWVCTDRGWTWISDEPFGWATYHYGRWALCHGIGWVWVPGCEWAPAWVSWRSSGTHIGWAPLPPETLAYRGGRCDSSVDVTFGIGSLWFNFVETRYFGSPIYHHCLPYTQNNIYINGTVNITNIYVHNRHVICGGPKYWDVQRQTERKPPFYRIEEDRSGRPGRDPLGMRPLVHGDRLRVSAPNVDVAWNDGLKPGKVKGRIESLKVQRQEELKPEVADHFRKTREESRGRAEQTIAELGGADRFPQSRVEQLDVNRRRVTERRDQTAKTDKDRVREDQYVPRKDGPKIFPPRVDDKDVKELNDRNRKQREDVAEQTRQRQETQRVEEQTARRENGPKVFPPKTDNNRVQDDTAARIRRQQEQIAEQNRQREEARTRQEQTTRREDGPKIFPPRNDNKPQDDSAARMRRQQEEQQAERSRQQQQQEALRQREQERQQQAEQARQQQQREQARQQQMEEARREQQREQARQQQQEESRREQARQQQEESQRQERNRQEQQRQEEDRRGRNR